MNLKYVEPTGHDYPKKLEETIVASSDGRSACCTFNRRGTLLAIGCHEGHINIWDFETRSIAKQLKEHKGVVTSVSWSRNGSKLLSSDWNGHLLLWDINTSTVLIKIKFNIPIQHSWLHGRSSKLAMIHLDKCQPLIVTFDKITTKPNSNDNKEESKTNATSDNKMETESQKLEISNDQQIILENLSSSNYKITAKSIMLEEFTELDQPKSPKCKS